MDPVRRTLAPTSIVLLIGMLTAAGCKGGSAPTAPSVVPATTPPVSIAPPPPSVHDRDATMSFSFQGVIGQTCFVCGRGSNQFGTGVPPGTPLTGTFTFDPNTPPTPTFESHRVDYVGVDVRLAIGTETVTGNVPSMAKIQIANGPPFGDSYSLIVEGGFGSGTIAGVVIDDFVWVLSAGSSLFADTSLPVGPFSLSGVGSRVCIGDCFNGEILEGDISAWQLGP